MKLQADVNWGQGHLKTQSYWMIHFKGANNWQVGPCPWEGLSVPTMNGWPLAELEIQDTKAKVNKK